MILHDNYNLSIVLIFLIMLFVFGLTIYGGINHYINEQRRYINELANMSMTQIKSTGGCLQRYSLINNLRYMKKYIGICLLLITLTFIGVSTFIVYDSRNYFKDYFETERKKLNLRSEASVDSLQFIITNQSKKIDSLNTVNSNNMDKIELLENEYNSKSKTINQLTKVIYVTKK